MQRPRRLWEQFEGKVHAELQRGSGRWPLQAEPCRLEPPWEPFNNRVVNAWDCLVNNWEKPWGGSWLQQALDWTPPVVPAGSHLQLPPPEYDYANIGRLVAIRIEQFEEDEETIPKAEQLLRSLTALSAPVSFEILGVGPEPRFDHQKFQAILKSRPSGKRGNFEAARIGTTEPFTTIQFVVDTRDASLVQGQITSQYPTSAVTMQSSQEDEDTFMLPSNVKDEDSFGAVLSLEGGHCYPLRTYGRLDPDPLGVAVAAMENLGEYDWAALQILMAPVRNDWQSTTHEALVHPQQPDDFWIPKELMRLVRDKFSSRLFAVSIRLMARRQDVFRHLLGWAEQFGNPPHQQLIPNQMFWLDGQLTPGERDSLASDALCRCTHRPGILLNTAELASLVHLPARTVASDRLRRVKSRTRPAPSTPPVMSKETVVLGENVHRGKISIVPIPADLRPRHCYIAGASGTGKSTLLLNLIMQDIEAGRGVGVLDPHGDLITAVLRRVPEARVKDVILFDPSDVDYPFALNILESKDEPEAERIVAETVMSLERYFPASWGPRLERILTYTIRTVLHVIPSATLADVEAMLVNDQFRAMVVPRIRNKRLRDFWEHEYRFLPKNAADPVLNKLSVFLSHGVVRNIVCQRRSAVDFDAVLNGGKILLANLSSGLLTSKIAGTFGSFIVTKVVNAAFRRAAIPEEQRRPFYLYVDEFQEFTNLSIGFERILAEARKYRLVLAGMANQYVEQLPSAVRQAVFGNVGVMVVFRLGVIDASLVAKEMGAFTADELMNLELGQAIARAGGSATAHNIQTYPPPRMPPADPTSAIRQQNRQNYARARVVVEREIDQSPLASDDSRQKKSDMPHAGAKGGTTKQPRKRGPSGDPPSDPREDDLVR